MEPNYEIKLHGSWLKVNDWIFRSWQGERRQDGVPFQGPVFYLGSDKVAPPPAEKPFGASKRRRGRS